MARKTEKEMLLEGLRWGAQVSMMSYPQYKGHFDGYLLVRVRHHVHTKAGLAFTAGEYAIGVPRDGKFWSLWSARNRVDTSVASFDVEVL